jgi:hypothetical protein
MTDLDKQQRAVLHYKANRDMELRRLRRAVKAVAREDRKWKKALDVFQTMATTNV